MSASPATEDAQALERLKATLWFHVGALVDEETIKLGINATPQFIGSLTELVWAQLATTATDLEAFAGHAGRSVVNVEDVLLLGRRNDGLKEILEGCAGEVRGRAKEKGEKK